MMAGWAGFTDDELQRLKDPRGKLDVRKQTSFVKPKTTAQRKSLPNQRRTDAQNRPISEALSDDQKLSKPAIPPNNNNANIKNTKQNINVNENVTTEGSATGLTDKNGNRERTAEMVTSTEEVKELNQSEVLNHEMSKLEKYQQQQKMIEELNKQRKAILAKAISERSKKAKAEASKLNQIQKELSHLDHLLTADVSIIRDRIEHASIAYMDARKRYEKAEREFVEAKMFLHEKAELKEQLTEHLYTIIHQNEIRKSQKLAELMRKLEMEISEGMDVQLVDLPLLTSFDSLQTISPTKSPVSSPLVDMASHQGNHGNKMAEKDGSNEGTVSNIPSTEQKESLKNLEKEATPEQNTEIKPEESTPVSPNCDENVIPTVKDELLTSQESHKMNSESGENSKTTALLPVDTNGRATTTKESNETTQI